MACNILAQNVSDQLNVHHMIFLKCVGGYYHKYIQQQSNVQKTLVGSFKNTDDKTKKKNSDTGNCKAFWLPRKSKKNKK